MYFIQIMFKKCLNSNAQFNESDKQPLLGREWIRKLNLLQINTVNSISTNHDKVSSLLQKYKDITDTRLDKIKGIQAKLTLKKDAMPVFMRARSVPFKLIPLVDKELDKLLSEGVIQKVNTSEWATPIVPRFGKLR
ncbi:hypothetical protein QE152_g5646 [Popillia japonica]|uniref:Reverse transcriptase n=1 Tax=Popillia japonica TaxID=7064 RepID=A0AAW1MQ20_POPJA